MRVEAFGFGALGIVPAGPGEPPAQRQVAFAALEREGVVDLVEMAQLDVAGAHDRPRLAVAVEHDQVIARLRQRLEVALDITPRCRTRTLDAGDDQRGELIG